MQQGNKGRKARGARRVQLISCREARYSVRLGVPPSMNPFHIFSFLFAPFRVVHTKHWNWNDTACQCFDYLFNHLFSGFSARMVSARDILSYMPRGEVVYILTSHLV
jgi:hypothetical protein